MSVVVSPLTLWRKWRGLDRDERATFREAIFLVPAMHVTVRIIGFNRLQQWVVNTATRTGAAPQPTADLVRRSVVNINRVKRYSPLRGNCLSQSLALSRLLRRRGITPDLRLGVRLTGSKFDAHAWVEYDGRVLNDTQDVQTRFSALMSKTGAP